MRRSNLLRRIIIIWFVFSALFLLLGGRLFWIQVIKGRELAEMAVRQRVQGLTLLSGRGDIQDRYGRSLLDRERLAGLAAFPAYYAGREKEAAELYAAVPGIDRILQAPRDLAPFWISTGVDQNILSGLPAAFPGIVACPAVRRYGPGLLASHTIGYLNKSEGCGVSGIELIFDEELSRGQQVILGAMLDGLNRPITEMGCRLSRSKQGSLNVILSIDRDLQQEAEQIADHFLTRGAVVVMDPSNGDILALVSRPNFDPENLAVQLQGGSSPLLNRAICGYQPGSIFKTVVAAGVLEEGLAGMFQTFNCSGGVEVSELFVPCSHLHPEDELTMVEAYAHSCNTVFINLALKLGGEKLYYYARQFGLGGPTGIQLDGQEGYFPAAEKMENPRFMANTAIGQGEVLATPLQVARMMAIIAGGGRDIKPRLVLALADGERRVRNYGSWKGRRVISKSTANKLSYMMQAVSALGTGRGANITDQPVGVKTGTAQSGRYEADREILNRWIAGFYPLDHPRAVIVVFADEVKEGGVNQAFGEIALYLERTAGP